MLRTLIIFGLLVVFATRCSATELSPESKSSCGLLQESFLLQLREAIFVDSCKDSRLLLRRDQPTSLIFLFLPAENKDNRLFPKPKLPRWPTLMSRYGSGLSDLRKQVLSLELEAALEYKLAAPDEKKALNRLNEALQLCKEDIATWSAMSNLWESMQTGYAKTEYTKLDQEIQSAGAGLRKDNWFSGDHSWKHDDASNLMTVSGKPPTNSIIILRLAPGGFCEAATIER